MEALLYILLEHPTAASDVTFRLTDVLLIGGGILSVASGVAYTRVKIAGIEKDLKIAQDRVTEIKDKNAKEQKAFYDKLLQHFINKN